MVRVACHQYPLLLHLPSLLGVVAGRRCRLIVVPVVVVVVKKEKEDQEQEEQERSTMPPMDIGTNPMD